MIRRFFEAANDYEGVSFQMQRSAGPSNSLQKVLGEGLKLAKLIIKVLQQETDTSAEVRFGGEVRIVTSKNSEGEVLESITQKSPTIIVFRHKAK